METGELFKYGRVKCTEIQSVESQHGTLACNKTVDSIVLVMT